jgi:hypothetical protein
MYVLAVIFTGILGFAMTDGDDGSSPNRLTTKTVATCISELDRLIDE